MVLAAARQADARSTLVAGGGSGGSGGGCGGCGGGCLAEGEGPLRDARPLLTLPPHASPSAALVLAARGILTLTLTLP